MQKVLVTGGAGFVGVNLVPELLKAGFQVTVIDNESVGKRENLKGCDVEFIHGDITDKSAVEEAVQNKDSIIHLAASTNVIKSIESPLENFAINVGGILNILEAMRKFNVTTIINASTGGAISGNATPPIHEGLVPAPISPYGAAKLCVEAYLSAYAGSYGIKATSLRFSNVYGPRSYHKLSVVAHFIKEIMAGKTLKLYGGGSQTRDFIHVFDICQGILKAMDAKKPGVFQLGTNTPTSVLELVEILKIVMKNKYQVKVEHAETRVGEVQHNFCSFDKAFRELGFEPKYKLKEGIENTFEWFVNNTQ